MLDILHEREQSRIGAPVHIHAERRGDVVCVDAAAYEQMQVDAEKWRSMTGYFGEPDPQKFSLFEGDAKLGALVRQMGNWDKLEHCPEGWRAQEGGSAFPRVSLRDTPEEALQALAALKETPTE
jgi:hypothetical protein